MLVGSDYIFRLKIEWYMIKCFKKSGLANLNELYFPNDKIDWPDPWWCLKDNLQLRNRIQKELNLEVSPNHPIWGLKPVVIGKTDANDDVIVHLNNKTFACVNLIWHGKVDRFPSQYPSTSVFESVTELQFFLDEEAKGYT